MRLDSNLKLEFDSVSPGITTGGALHIGHKHRCPCVRIEPYVYLGDACQIESKTIGMGTFIGCGSVLRNTSQIGRFTTIGENCRIGIASEAYAVREDIDLLGTSVVLCRQTLSWYSREFKLRCPYPTLPAETTMIGNDVWIGDSVLIKEGLRIGDGAVIVSGSVVCSDIPPYAVASGNPAVILRYRFPSETVKRMVSIRWWDYGISLLHNLTLPELTADQLLEVLELQTEAVQKIPFCSRYFLFRSLPLLNHIYAVHTVYGTKEGESATSENCHEDQRLLYQIPET